MIFILNIYKKVEDNLFIIKKTNFVNYFLINETIIKSL